MVAGFKLDGGEGDKVEPLCGRFDSEKMTILAAEAQKSEEGKKEEAEMQPINALMSNPRRKLGGPTTKVPEPWDPTKPKTFVVQVESAGFHGGNFAKIFIDDDPVDMALNENDNDRGLHIAVLNHLNGQIDIAQIFDTYKTSEALNAFIKSDFNEGSIVVAACKDECSISLSDEAKLWFEQMGSKHIWDLTYRHAWAFIGILGGDQAATANEALSSSELRSCSVT